MWNQKLTLRLGWSYCRPFTLIELLVVIAIIAILAGLLLPTLRKAKAKARMIECAGRLKQLGPAILMFADDYGGSLPRNAVADTVHGNNYDADWHWGPPFNGYYWDELLDYLSKGSISDSKQLDIYHCPAADKPLFDLWQGGGAEEWRYQVYGYNPYLSCDYRQYASLPSNDVGWSKLIEIKSPADCVFLADDGVQEGTFYRRWPSALAKKYGYVGNVDNGGVTPWHEGVCNYLHVDGHVKGYTAAGDWINASNFSTHRAKYFHPAQNLSTQALNPPAPHP